MGSLTTFFDGVEAMPFNVTAGSDACELVDSDNCFQSVNYPNDYAYSKTCTIAVNETGRLNVVDFDIQENSPCSYDYLTVGGTKYCGTTGPPQNARINSGDTITWTSNYFTVKKGFKICYWFY